MKISDVMTKNPTCCLPSDAAQVAAIIMRDEDTGIVPVVDDEKSRRLIGVVTDRDLCVTVIADGQTYIMAEGRDPTSVRVEEFMTRRLVCCSPDDDLESALELMRENQVRRILIVNGQREVQGIVSMADVVRRGEIASGETRETLKRICEPTDRASRPRAESTPEAT